MLQQISKIKVFLWELLEKELVAVLAVCFVALGIWLVKADTDTTNLSFTILDAGTLTVTAPNGGEDWQVDSSQHITWDSTGSINSVKIELQRTVGGDWETLIAATINDGDYPWPVTSPTTTTATVRISSTTVPAVYDDSNDVFTISAAPEGPSGPPGGYVPTYPMIDSVSPMSFYYNVATELVIRGLGFEDRAWATLNQVIFPIQKPHPQNLVTINLLPNTLSQGTYRLCIYNTLLQFDCYPRLISVTAETITPPTTGGVGEEYVADLVNQSPNITLKVRDTATLWAEFRNNGTATWYQDGKNPVRLGTDAKRNRRSGFYHSSWIKYNRPVLVNKIVKPGEIGRFEFTIKAPWTAKKYTEYFKPVAEYKAWMSGQSQVKWVITVKSKTLKEWFTKPGAPTQPSTKLTTPSTGGKVESSFKPGATLLFSDNIEKLYQWTIKSVTSILTKLHK